jgi:hypothetical protein
MLHNLVCIFLTSALLHNCCGFFFFDGNYIHWNFVILLDLWWTNKWMNGGRGLCKLLYYFRSWNHKVWVWGTTILSLICFFIGYPIYLQSLSHEGSPAKYAFLPATPICLEPLSCHYSLCSMFLPIHSSHHSYI